MNNNAARKVSLALAPSFAEVFQVRCEDSASLFAVFQARCQESASRYRSPHHDAVDALQAVAVFYGFVDELGQDAVQAMMAAAFGFPHHGEEIQKPANLEISPTGGNHAAASTVDALTLSLRERGQAALAEPNCRRRLADLSTKQVREVIARLMGLRLRYSAITDDLLLRLRRQL